MRGCNDVAPLLSWQPVSNRNVSSNTISLEFAQNIENTISCVSLCHSLFFSFHSNRIDKQRMETILNLGHRNKYKQKVEKREHRFYPSSAESPLLSHRVPIRRSSAIYHLILSVDDTQSNNNKKRIAAIFRIYRHILVLWKAKQGCEEPQLKILRLRFERLSSPDRASAAAKGVTTGRPALRLSPFVLMRCYDPYL